MSSLLARAALAALISSLFSTVASAVPVRASLTTNDAVTRLKANAGGQVFERSLPGGAYTMLQAIGQQPLMLDGGTGSPVDRAQMFLSIYGAALGISNPATQLELTRVSTDQKGQWHVHLDQVHEGLPVYGARVIVHMNNVGITGINGVFLRKNPSTQIATRSVASLRQAALLTSNKAHNGQPMAVRGGRWVIYPVGLLQGGLQQTRLAYAVQVASTKGRAELDEVLIDAQTGIVLDRFTKIESILNREIYTPDQTAAPTLDEHEEVTVPPSPYPAGQVSGTTLINDPGHNGTVMSDDAPGEPTENLWTFAGGTWALYKKMFDRDGYDDCGNDPSGGPCRDRNTRGPVYVPLRGDDYTGQIQKSVYLVNDNCPNAYWNGDSTNYCPGFDADDVVSHEWSHAYTQFTHGLIYAYQSGALNESWSDIFGETYDLTNKLEGPLGALTLVEHKYYEEGGSRWVVGEDLSEQAAALLLRDMWQPDDFPAANAGSTTSENYTCGAGDNGGVHANSSVPNHAFAMLVDGTKGQDATDSFNGQKFDGIGIIKAAQIYFYAENNYQTPTTDFPQHANALRMSCENLKGVALRDPTGAVRNDQVITQGDCDKLNQAMLAVVMDAGTPCPYKAVLLPAGEPAVCDGAIDVLNQTWENGDAGWTKTSAGVFPGWDPDSDLHNFILKSDNLPPGHSGTVAFADNIPIGEPGGGNCPGGDGYNPQTDDMSGEYSYLSPVFTVPAGDLKLRWEHYVRTEQSGGVGVDGGQLYLKVNDGDFTLVEDFVFNGYNGSLFGAADTSTNPHGGEDAWAGTDINPPSGAGPAQWGTSVVDLATLAKPGDLVQLRYTWSQDGCNGTDGWYIDNIRAYTCPTLAAPTLSADTDYENPDTNGSFTLKWTRPEGASGPDLLQKSKVSCAPLLFDDAEDGIGAWTLGGDAIGTAWDTSNTKPQHSPDTAFWVNTNKSDEGFGGNATMTRTAAINIPATGTTKLSFLDWYINEEDDAGTVEISKDNGATWDVVYKINRALDREAAAPLFASEPLNAHEVDITAYAGESIKLRFNFTYGESIYFFQDPFGWYVDDVKIENDDWGDVAVVPAASKTLSNQLDGSSCYRVRTAYPIGNNLIPGKFSNIVPIKVQAGLTNLAPLANAGIDQAVLEGTKATLDASLSTEPNGDALTYSWRQMSGFPVTLADATTSHPSFIAPDVSGETPFTFEVTVRDPQGLSSTDSVTVAVLDTPRASIKNNRLFGGALAPFGLAELAVAAMLRRRRRSHH